MWKTRLITAFIFTIIACLLTSMRVHAQKVTLSYRKASLKTIIADIEHQTEFKFFYNKNLLRYAQKVDIQVTNVPLKEALEVCFKEQPLKYVIIENRITIQPKPGAELTPVQERTYTKGMVTDEKGMAVPGVTVSLLNGKQQVASNENGGFTLTDVEPDDTVVVSSINHEAQMIPVDGRRLLNVVLKEKVGQLSEVSVVSTGYQELETKRMTGSAITLDNKLLNRMISTNIIDRLEGVTPGLAFTKNIVSSLNQSEISIRGRSTIYANPNPLIILDNFPFNGSLSSINPNDVESVTILKDPAAAAIWGAFAGNGVIVINTKKGKYSQAPKVFFNSNITVGGKRDLHYEPYLSSGDYVEFERMLFDMGYYRGRETHSSRPPLSQAVEILIKKRDHLITPEDAEAQLAQLKQHDLRSDMEKYFQRRSVSQQYGLGISGGSINNHYYFSAGYDKNANNTVGSTYDRLTLDAQNSFAFLERKLELTTGVIFSYGRNKVNTDLQQVTGLSFSRPYSHFVDEQGNPAIVPVDFRQTYKDTAGGGNLLDWNYRPLTEIGLTDDETKLTEYRFNIGLKYKVLKGLVAEILYQYNKSDRERNNLRSEGTYYTRNLINKFTQINGGTVDRKIPLGGILDQERNNLNSHNIRTQINYNRKWNEVHQLTAIGGWELRTVKEQEDVDRQYGYDQDRQIGAIVDYQTAFPMYYNPRAFDKIPYQTKNRKLTANYLSYFSSLLYTFRERYSFSASARKDESNIFGVRTNQKGVPLWSAGLGWQINKENFYKMDWLPYLKFRFTHGYTGNVDRSVSALTTAVFSGLNFYNAPYAEIENPPNSDLRWEKIQMINFGLDFATKNNRISGSLEYYFRKGRDLIAKSPIDPTTGVSEFTGNTGEMKGKGLEIVLHSKNITGKFRWETNCQVSYTFDKVSKFDLPNNIVGLYYNGFYLNPYASRPLYSIYSIPYGGLDSIGDPLGIVDGKPTKDYSTIFRSSDLDNLKYHGSTTPIVFGNVMNTFSWKQWELSLNLVWKAGYYFRRQSIHYYSLVNNGTGHPDWNKRWQKPGDERLTNVPAFKLNDAERDDLYNYSDLLVEKGDHIRLQDVQLGYSLSRQRVKKLPVQSLRFSFYMNNLGILWRANKYGIDPDYSFDGFVPPARTFSVGMKVDL